MSNDFKSIMKRFLDNVDDTLDKRQGSIIYDALAPAALELEQCYVTLEIYKEQTYLKTATGENLDNRVADYGLTRNEPTKAVRIVNVYNNNDELYNIPIGSQFSIPAESGGYNYTLTEEISTGKFKAECQTPGTVGNEYTGVLLPLYNITGLGRAEIVGTFKAAEDTETDEHLRARALNRLNLDAFGGNQADYKRYMENIDGVGGCKVFPIWNGGGTVKISFINSDMTIPSSEFVDEVQTIIDPITNHGEGLGIAPIGHHVTVVAPTAQTVNVSATVELLNNYALSNIVDEIRDKIAEYIEECQGNWENTNTLRIYIARVIAAILTVEGVDNVTNVKINNQASDLVLTQTAATQLFPVIGDITINEN